jgi:malonyl-CoA O-methyltransferase
MSIQQAYDQWSSSYDVDQNLTRDLDSASTREILGMRRFRAVLEAGCGTGKNTAYLSRLASRLVAMDFSRGMLSRAYRKVSAPGLGFVLSDLARVWPLPAASFDLVTFNLVLEHIEDLPFVFSEAARVLRPGGTLLVSELHPFRQYQGARAVFSNGQQVGSQAFIPAFVHHISNFMQAASQSELHLELFRELWHAQDEGRPPRLAVFLFLK